MIVFIAMLSIFIALYNALKERKYDLAIMRSLGSSRKKVFVLIILESMMITLMSIGLGLSLGHGVIELLTHIFEASDKIGLTGKLFLPSELIVIIGALFIGFLTALIPAIQAYKTDISEVLAKG